MKIAFFGTPEFALTVLQHLHTLNHEIVAVVCAVDKPQGRGNKLTPPPTKVFALEKGIKVLQYNKVRLEGVEDLKALNADIFVTAAFGQILSQEILDIAPLGVINVHGSLLPKYRGAAPVQYALLNGEEKTGVTIMKTFVGIDDGDMILKKEIDILPEDNAETLMDKIAHLGAKALEEALVQIENGTAVYTPQNHEEATFTRMLKKENAFINFNTSAKAVVNFVRAFNPNPVAKFVYNGEEHKVFKASVIEQSHNYKAGEVVSASIKEGLVIACQENLVKIEELSAPSSKKLSAKDFLNGRKIEIGTILN
ncbi:MAG: methionyl-tRNA formyltransferase [Christensenellales bacterium]|jgi:methionyl-tRNA formyltransferase